MFVNQQFEIRFRHFKWGLQSERTVKVTAKTRNHAERVFLKSVPADRVAILSIYPVISETERVARKMEKAMDGVGWTAAIITGLLILLVIIMQVGKWFYGW